MCVHPMNVYDEIFNILITDSLVVISEENFRLKIKQETVFRVKSCRTSTAALEISTNTIYRAMYFRN